MIRPKRTITLAALTLTLLALTLTLLALALAPAASADATATPASIDFGQVALGADVPTQTVGLQIDSPYAFHDARVDSASGAPQIPVTVDSSSCGSVTGPGSCQIVLRLDPTFAYSFTGTLVVRACADVQPSCEQVEVPLTAQVTSDFAASVPLNPIDYGRVPLQTTATRSLTLTLDHGFSLAPSALFIADGRGTQPVNRGTCAGLVGPATCTIRLSYRPLGIHDTAGLWRLYECRGESCDQELTIDWNGLPISRFLGGANPVPPVLLPGAHTNLQSVDFGDVRLGTTATRMLRITLDSGYTYDGGVGPDASSSNFTFDDSACAGVVGPAWCTAVLTFTPASTAADHADYRLSEVGQPADPIKADLFLSGRGVDRTPPAITCTPPDRTVWYAHDVAVPCTATDTWSPLADPADQSFTLATSLPARTESRTVATNSHQVCDSAGNCATAQAYTYKVDEKAPVIACNAAAFLYHQTGTRVTGVATDGGSGPPTRTVGAPAPTTTPGAHSVTLKAADKVGNASTRSCSYSVSFVWDGFVAPLKSPPALNAFSFGRTITLRWRLRDASGALVHTLGAIRAILRKSTSCTSPTSDPAHAVDVSSSSGTHPIYDRTAGAYVFPLASPGRGCFTVFVKLADGHVFPLHLSVG